MIGHQRPCINGGFGIACKRTQPLDKIFALGNIVDDPALFNSSAYHMMQGAWGIQSGLTRLYVPPARILVSIK
jgi:hypothetical protein